MYAPVNQLLYTMMRAIEFATDAHKAQKRKASGEPYIIHPIRVLRILTEAGITDDTVLIAAVLHDVVEDTSVTLDEITRVFGKRVSNFVFEVTNNPDLSKVDKKKAQVTKASNMSSGAKLIKMADMIDNLSDLLVAPPPDWTKERVKGYFVWKYVIFSSLRGVNSYLVNELEKLFSSVLTIEEMMRLSMDKAQSSILQEYYNTLQTQVKPESD